MIDWLCNSGAAVTVTLNPCHWLWWPRVYRTVDDVWAGPTHRSWEINWIMFRLKLWVDNGAW